MTQKRVTCLFLFFFVTPEISLFSSYEASHEFFSPLFVDPAGSPEAGGDGDWLTQSGDPSWVDPGGRPRWAILAGDNKSIL